MPIALVFTVLGAIACESGETPPPVIAPPKAEAPPAWLNDAAQRCALAASCAHSHDAPRFLDESACVTAFAMKFARGEPLEKDAIYTCLGNAKTCDAAAACMHQGHDARATAYCVAHPNAQTACDGDTLISCGGDDPDESESKSCRAIGASCKEFAQAGGLLVHACFAADLCPHGATESRCDGDHALVSCHDGAVEKISCAPGTTCDAHNERPGERAASCEVQGGARCSASSTDEKKCDGDKLTECVTYGHAGSVRVTDCAAAGLRCAGSGERAGCYVPVKTECEAGPATCEGDALTFCAAGKMMHVACTRLGLGACSPSANGPHAACVVPGAR